MLLPGAMGLAWAPGPARRQLDSHANLEPQPADHLTRAGQQLRPQCGQQRYFLPPTFTAAMRGRGALDTLLLKHVSLPSGEPKGEASEL